MGIFSTWIKGWCICLVGSLLCLGLMAYKADLPMVDGEDSRQYLAATYNLAHYGIYSQDLTRGDRVMPGIGREPGLPYMLSWLFAVDRNGIGSITPACLQSDRGCGLAPYAAAQWLNRLLFAGAGICLFWAAFCVFSSLPLASVAGTAIWLNLDLQKSMDQMVSDPLALFLACALALAFAHAWSSVRQWRARGLMTLAGLLLGCLILTKAIFLYFLYLSASLSLLWLVWQLCVTRGRVYLRQVGGLMVIFFICAAIGPALWMQRNANVNGQFSLTDSREGIALSARAIYNDMNPGEYGTAFVYWLRGFGDTLAEKTIPEQYLARFDDTDENGFYQRGHGDFPRHVERLMREQQISRAEAEEIWTSALKQEILAAPLKHTLVTIPLFFRGVQRDLFVVLSLPGLVFLIWRAVARRDTLMLLLLSPSLFNLLFYPLISLNTTRYQITAAPAFAFGLVGAFLAWQSFLAWRARRAKAG